MTGRARVGQFIDQLGQVVFQEPLAFGLEERNGPLVILQVRAREAEIDLRRPLIQRRGLQPVGHRPVFGVAERFGVKELQLYLAMGDRRVVAQHLPHMVGIGAVGRDSTAQLTGVEQPQRDGFLQVGQDLLRARRQGVEFALCQVELHVRQPGIGEHVDADGDRRGGDDAEDGKGQSAHSSVRLPLIDQNGIQEQEESDEGREVDQVPQRDDAAGEVVEPVDNGDPAGELAERRDVLAPGSR